MEVEVKNNIDWRSLTAITVVQGTITLCWVIYALYLPELLTELGFSRQLAGQLLIVEHFLEMAIEPTFGYLSDRNDNLLGYRFPYITLGILLSASFFIILPMVTFGLSSDNFTRYLLPTLAVIWASAMAIFRSPLVALIARVAPPPELPIAASFLTLIQQLISALRFTAYGFILSLGSLFTFGIGSFALLLGAFTLRRMTPANLTAKKSDDFTFSSSFSQIIAIFLIGSGIGLGLRFMFAILPQIIDRNFGSESIEMGMFIFNIVLACSALLAGKLASKLGVFTAIITALIITSLSFILANQSLPVAIIIILLILVGFCFSTVFSTMIPVVLNIIPQVNSGFGVGMFFAGFSGGLNFFDIFINTEVTLTLFITKAIICWLITALIIYLYSWQISEQ